MKSWRIDQLHIIGYSSALEQPVLPRVLPPVFQVRDEPDTILMAPFSRVGEDIIAPVEVTVGEFDDFVAQGKATKLEAPIPGRADHDLWVNDLGTVRYEARAIVKNALATLFSEHLLAATQKLSTKAYADAARHAAVARAANPAHLDPLVIRAAAERLEGKTSQVAFTQHLAEKYIAQGEFRHLVEELIASLTSPVCRGANVMRGVATRKPKLYIALAAA